jgi:GT2 family glycosyltransferase
VDWVGGMFMLLRRDVFETLGGFDERYFLYYEDVDLCARLWSAGMRVMQLRQVSVIHLARRSSHRSLRYLVIHLVSMSRYFLSGSFWGMVWRSAFQSGARRS